MNKKLSSPFPTCVEIRRVDIDYKVEWQQAIDNLGPHTPSHYSVRKVGDMYPPHDVTRNAEVVMLNYIAGDGSWARALEWAQDMGYRQTDPRCLFNLGAQLPQLHRGLGLDRMFVVATKSTYLDDIEQACCVWWSGDEQGAELESVYCFGKIDCWFLFM